MRVCLFHFLSSNLHFSCHSLVPFFGAINLVISHSLPSSSLSDSSSISFYALTTSRHSAIVSFYLISNYSFMFVIFIPFCHLSFYSKVPYICLTVYLHALRIQFHVFQFICPPVSSLRIREKPKYFMVCLVVWNISLSSLFNFLY